MRCPATGGRCEAPRDPPGRSFPPRELRALNGTGVHACRTGRRAFPALTRRGRARLVRPAPRSLRAGFRAASGAGSGLRDGPPASTPRGKRPGPVGASARPGDPCREQGAPAERRGAWPWSSPAGRVGRGPGRAPGRKGRASPPGVARVTGCRRGGGPSGPSRRPPSCGGRRPPRRGGRSPRGRCAQSERGSAASGVRAAGQATGCARASASGRGRQMWWPWP